MTMSCKGQREFLSSSMRLFISLALAYTHQQQFGAKAYKDTKALNMMMVSLPLPLCVILSIALTYTHQQQFGAKAHKDSKALNMITVSLSLPL